MYLQFYLLFSIAKLNFRLKTHDPGQSLSALLEKESPENLSLIKDLDTKNVREEFTNKPYFNQQLFVTYGTTIVCTIMFLYHFVYT